MLLRKSHSLNGEEQATGLTLLDKADLLKSFLKEQGVKCTQHARLRKSVPIEAVRAKCGASTSRLGVHLRAALPPLQVLINLSTGPRFLCQQMLIASFIPRSMTLVLGYDVKQERNRWVWEDVDKQTE